MSSTSGSSDRHPGSGAGSEEGILVGVVLRPHGVRGEVKVQSLTDIDSRFAAGSALRLRDPNGQVRTVRITAGRSHKGGAIVRFDGIDDRDQAERLRGGRLEVGEDDVPPAPDGLYYHFQLVGCACHDRTTGPLGQVVDVVEDGGGDLLVVAKDGGGTLPIPFVEAFLLSVDIEGRRIELDLPEGLIETCTSRS